MALQSSITEYLSQSIDQINEQLSKIDSSVKKVSDQPYYMFTFGDLCHRLGMNSVQRSLRGLLFNSETKQILSRTFSVPYDTDNIDIVPKDTEIEIHRLYDGTMLRLSYFPIQSDSENDHGSWNLLTNSQINAYGSSWSGKKSFGEFFDGFIVDKDAFYAQLDKECTYIFTLCHPQNTIVVNYKEPALYHMSTINNASGIEKPRVETGNLSGINLSQVEYFTNLSPEEAFKHAMTENIEDGFIIVSRSSQTLTTRYRIQSHLYNKRDSVLGMRNIHPKERHQALANFIVNEITRGNIASFLKEFPNHRELVAEYQHKLAVLPEKLMAIYRDKYITKSQPWINGPIIHKFIQFIHTCYLNNLRPYKARMTPIFIQSSLMTMSVVDLTILLNA